MVLFFFFFCEKHWTRAEPMPAALQPFYEDRFSHADEVTSTGTKRRGEETISFVDCALLKRERRIIDKERQGTGDNEPN